MAIYGALYRKQLPRRPSELPEENKKTSRMWELLVKCWDHDLSIRPDAGDIAPAVSKARPEMLTRVHQSPIWLDENFRSLKRVSVLDRRSHPIKNVSLFCELCSPYPYICLKRIVCSLPTELKPPV